MVHGRSGIGAAAASFFAAVHADPVPEVFDIRGAQPPSAEPADLGSVMSDVGFPEPFEPGFSAFDPVVRPTDSVLGDSTLRPDQAVRSDPPGRDEGRTHVPPGFERRTFGPFPEEPGRGGGSHLGPTEPGHHDEPRGFETIAPANAFTGVAAPAPPAPLLPPIDSLVMPPTFAPPEPAPWIDPGWMEFPRPDLDREPSEALVGVGAGGRPMLPRRTPQIPDVPDFARFDNDPLPDPAAELIASRIATFLRDDEDSPSTEPRPDGFDLAAVLDAVRGVRDVRDAHLRWNASAGHTLRIEFADGADEGEVTRTVVRLLREKMGLSAAPSASGPRPGGDETTWDRPIPRPSAVATARVPMRPQSAPGIAVGQPLPSPSTADIPRLVVDNVTVTRLGAEATVEVRLSMPGHSTSTVGVGRGPGVDAYLSRLAATAAAHAADQALCIGGNQRGRVFVEHVSVVPFGVVEVAVVVLLLTYGGQSEQLSGSAIVGEDPHRAVVRATLAALNRRLESLLS